MICKYVLSYESEEPIFGSKAAVKANNSSNTCLNVMLCSYSKLSEHLYKSYELLVWCFNGALFDIDLTTEYNEMSLYEKYLCEFVFHRFYTNEMKLKKPNQPK